MSRSGGLGNGLSCDNRDRTGALFARSREL
jgi:hypothetical protein